MKFLFLTSDSPYEGGGGAKLRDQSMIELLKEKGEVDLLHFGGSIRRKTNPWFKKLISPLRSYVVNGYDCEIEKILAQKASPGKILWVSRLAMAQYIPKAREFGYIVVLDEHNVESDLLKSKFRRGLFGLYDSYLANQCEKWEKIFCEQANAVVCTSELDRKRLGQMSARSKVFVVPNCIDVERYKRLPDLKSSVLLFPGTLDYAPNIEGLKWFVDKILPFINYKNLKIIVAGARPGGEFKKFLQAHRIEVISDPGSMLPYFEKADVVFVPLLNGSGTRLKILEAVAYARAVVTTEKDAEGLAFNPGVDLFIENEPIEFAQKISFLLGDVDLRKKMTEHAHATLESKYD